MKTTGTRNRISSATLAGDRHSPAGWVGSLALHGAIIVGTLFTVSHTLDIADLSPPVVPVDLVTIAEKTNIRASAHHMRHIAPTPTPPVPKEMPAPPTPPQVQPQQQPQPAPPAPPTPPKEAEPLAEARLPVIPKHRPPPAPKPEVKQPEEKPQPDDKKKSFDVDKVLALLNKVSPSQAAAPDAPEGQRNVRGFGAQNAMTADLVSALQSQIRPCWNVGAISGDPHPERLVVSFDLFLSPDGSVAQPPQLLANSSDPYFHAAAAAAVRAIYTCAPYKLPMDRYAQWKEIKPFNFSPQSMMEDQ